MNSCDLVAVLVPVPVSWGLGNSATSTVRRSVYGFLQSQPLSDRGVHDLQYRRSTS